MGLPREKKIPELSIIPYSPVYRKGYGDDRFLLGADDALRFYRGDDVDDMMKEADVLVSKLEHLA